MKLELKHLAPYLPYGLKAHALFNNGNTQVPLIKEINASNIMSFINEDTNYKPILKPLADCLKDLNNDEFLCIDSCDVTYSKLHSGKETFKIYPVQAEWIFTTDVYENFYEYLFINHFDLFGLIDANLAIDINSLNP